MMDLTSLSMSTNERARGYEMEKKEFSKARRHLEKTQGQMAPLLGVSLKAIQSFEQGWRKIPTYIERQTLFLLAMKTSRLNKARPCWETRKCSLEIKQNCPAWEFRVGNLCWFINGTVCDGEIQESWRKKMRICQKCVVFQAIFGASPGERHGINRRKRAFGPKPRRSPTQE